MNITVSLENRRVPVTVVALDGQLDGQNYQDLIAKTLELYDSGAHDILFDMTKLTYISSAGLVALHTAALIVRGESLPDSDHGWAAIKSMDRSRGAGKQEHIKLLNPSSNVNSVFEVVGFSLMFDIFDDREKALQSF